MENRFLTIDSLIEYCKANKVKHFSSKEIGKPIVVSTFGQAECNNSFKYDTQNDPGLMPVTLKACHCGVNVNASKISEANMAKALPSFCNKPILAEIVEDNGNIDFGTHAMEYVTDKNGNTTIKYIERAVGIVPESCNARMEYDKIKNRMYTYVDGYIFTYYGNETASILQRKNGTKVSVELEVNEFDWSEEDNCIEFTDFTFSGVTLLSEKIGCGMEGSRLDLVKLPEAKFDYSEQLIEMQEKLNQLLSCFNNTNNDNSNGKEENAQMENMENTQVEDTTVDNSVEETETVVENSADETVEDTTQTEGENTDMSQNEDEDTPNVGEEETDEVEDEAEEETEEPTENNACGSGSKKKKKCSLEEYEALKNEYETYKANHSHTNEEYAELADFKADYDKKQKEALFADEAYADIAQTEEFKALITESETLSYEDCEIKANAMLGKFSKATFSAQAKEKKSNRVAYGLNIPENTSSSIYGDFIKKKSN